MTANIKTTIGGIIAAVGIAGTQIPQVPEEYRWIFIVMAAVGPALIGVTAKDYDTHSTIVEVEKATDQKIKDESLK